MAGDALHKVKIAAYAEAGGSSRNRKSHTPRVPSHSLLTRNPNQFFSLRPLRRDLPLRRDYLLLLLASSPACGRCCAIHDAPQ
jgi:hypothetical protein